MDKHASRVWTVPKSFKRIFTNVGEHRVHALRSEKKMRSHSAPLDLPIVLLHGALASRRYLMPTANVLAEKIEVYVYEMPGHGGSSKPPTALSVEEQAKIMADWFRLNNIRRAYLFANSYGCQIAARLAASHPELIERLILSGPTVDPSAPTLVEQWFRLFTDSFIEPPMATVQMFLDISDMGIKFALQTASQMISNDIKPNLAKIQCKTIVVRGDKDPIAPQKWTELASEILNDGQNLAIKNSPHCVNYVSPIDLSQVILDFVSRN